ncbi:MAG: RodZ domain-containing protein [Pseudomonadota bacterium]
MAAETLKVGEILKQAREGYHLTLEQVEQDIKIRTRILDAIERNDFDLITGGMPYVIGHTRSYAEYLRLDGDTIVGHLKQNMGGVSRRAPELIFPVNAHDSPVPHKKLIWSSVAVVALIMLGGTLISSFQDAPVIPEVPADLRQPPLAQNTPATPDVDPALQAANLAPTAAAVTDAGQGMLPAGAIADGKPVEVTPVTTPAAESVEAKADVSDAAGPPPLVMKAIQDSWMEVRTADGKVVYSGLLKSGKSLVLREERNDLVLTTGNAGGIEVYVNGQILPQLGDVGQVRKNISLDPSQLQTRLN